MEDKEGVVYILSNPAMPELIKIGFTEKKSINERMRELYTSALPYPFTCEYACRVNDARRVEATIHFAFESVRVNHQREFFKIDPDKIIAVLELVSVENVTPEVEKALDSGLTPTEVRNKLRVNRPQMTFEKLGIPIGSTLNFIKDNDITVTVVNDKNKVSYNGEETTLSALSTKLLDVKMGVRGTAYWLYNGKLLSDRYEEVYPEKEN